MSVSVFKKIADIALGAKSRRDEEHRQFLAYYRELVETVPANVAELFGTLNGVAVAANGRTGDYGIELTATDYLFWKDHLENKGVRFVHGTEAVKSKMLSHLAQKVEHGLSADERKSLLALLLSAS